MYFLQDGFIELGVIKGFSLGKVKEIVDDGVVIIDAEKKENKLTADTVIIADLVPNKEIKLGKYGKADVYMIGDAIQVRRGYGAVHDGYRMGMKATFKSCHLMHRDKDKQH